MRTITNLALGTAIALVGMSSTDAAAQQAGDPLRPEIAVHIRLGDELAARGMFAQARHNYRTAVDLIRANGALPADPVRRIAYTYYYEGKYRNAISALDRLATEAGEFGDVVTQAWAMADAAWILGKEGKASDLWVRGVAQRVEDLRQLLRSPLISESVRSEIWTKRFASHDMNRSLLY